MVKTVRMIKLKERKVRLLLKELGGAQKIYKMSRFYSKFKEEWCS
jgi:hypothetical protein